MAGASISSRTPSGIPPPPTHIDERFRVEKVLGRGGMGEVLAVLEESSGRRLALKRLHPGARPKQVLLLQREFHTLSTLQHPAVVQAYDYGRCDGMHYYTMELLGGADVEGKAPLPWPEVVPILRDVCSALALVHARRLLHRDVTARNVWQTPSGAIKLIDFGALTSFGTARDIAGTPPYVAPEALRTHELDQRTDLYALGALGYFLLTGRHAVPARSLAELEEHWAEGAIGLRSALAALERPDLPELPEPLEQLIEALLSQEPAARPASTTEVIDRLSAVLPGASSVGVGFVEGVLASKKFVGREREQKRLGELLEHAISKSGACVGLLGPRGSGRSRLLSELSIQARLAGAATISICGDGERTGLSAAARATLKLLQTLPGLTRRCAAPYVGVLGHLSSELRSALGAASELEAVPHLAGELRVRLQHALHALWLQVAQERQVVLLLDDLQDMDEGSAAFFASLGRDAGGARLLVVAAVRSEHEATVPARARPFLSKAILLPVAALDADECTEMLRSIFGDVEHVSRAAHAIARAAEGNPGRITELCDYLVRSDTIHYHDGAWVLPQELPRRSMPSSHAALDDARLTRLGADAKALARSLSVVQGAASLELCAQLGSKTAERMFAALDELCAGGILLSGERGYRFRREPLREVLYGSLSEAEAQQAHLAAGEALLNARDPVLLDRVTAGVHLLRAGGGRRGAEVVQAAVLDLAAAMPEEPTEFAQQLEQALGLLRELGLSKRELLVPLCVLSWFGYFVDRRYGFNYGDEALELAESVCGIETARRLRPWLGRKLSLYVALLTAALKCRKEARTSKLVPDFPIAMRTLIVTASVLGGMYTLCIARDRVLACLQSLEPLTALGKHHVANIVYQFGLAIAGTISDNLADTRRRWQQLIARLGDPRPIKGMDENTRSYYTAGSLFAGGALECWRDRSRALEIADQLESCEFKLFHVSADQLRSVYYANQGDVQQAERYKARVETRALQRGTTWQVEIWDPSSTLAVAVRLKDAVAIKRALGQLDHLAADTPSLQPYVQQARASYALLRGRFAEALELLEALLETRSPDALGFARTVAQLGEALNGLKQHARAAQACQQAMARLSSEDFAFPPMTLQLPIELARARAGLGHVEEAARALDLLLAQHAPGEGPLTLGALHDARAEVAKSAGDEDGAQRHFALMESWYRATGCPTLIQYCDRSARRRAGAAGPGMHSGGASTLQTGSRTFASGVTQESGDGLLAKVIQESMAAEGAILRVSAGVSVLHQSRAEPLPEAVLAWADARMAAARYHADETEDADAAPVDLDVSVFADQTWRVSPITSLQEGNQTLVGALLLRAQTAAVPRASLHMLAGHLERNMEKSPATVS